jgi:predicted RNA-binding protein (virulence factor B family)
MTSIDTMLREVLVTLKEEQACLKLWFEDKSVNEDVRRGIEISLTKISEALGKLAALKKGDDGGKTEGPANL